MPQMWSALRLVSLVVVGLLVADDPAAAQPTFGPTRNLQVDAAVQQDNDSFAKVAGDGAGHWVAVWHTFVPSFLDVEVRTAHSSDDGSTWSTPQYLNIDFATDSAHDYSPDVATDGAGLWIAAWNKNQQTVVARSTDNGLTWSAPVAIGPMASSTNTVGAIVYGMGAWVVSFTHNTTVQVVRSTNGGLTWSAPVTVNSSACCLSTIEADVATDGAGGWVITWSDSVFPGDRDLRYVRSTTNGASWSAEMLLHSDAATDARADSEPKITVGQNNVWIVSSQGYVSDADIYVARGFGSPGSPPTVWNAAQVIVLSMNVDPPTRADFHPDVAADGAGNAAIVFVRQDTAGGPNGNDYDPMVSVSTDNGLNWSNPVLLKPTGSNDVQYSDAFPRIKTDGAGRWIATWFSDDPVYGSTTATDREILFTGSGGSGLDHFLCYKGTTGNLPPPPPVTLADAFGTGPYNVQRMQRFCTPADKNGEGMTDPATHLAGYPVSGPGVGNTFGIVNQFGALSVTAVKKSFLYVPSGKSIPPAPPPGPPAATSEVDHYRCRQAKVTPQTPDLPTGIVVSVVDQFGTRNLEVKRLVAYCTPTDKNAEGIHHPLRQLACYKVRPLPALPNIVAQYENQFALGLVGIRKERELCVPSQSFP